jgi:hypothetical protein
MAPTVAAFLVGDEVKISLSIQAGAQSTIADCGLQTADLVIVDR